MASMKLSMPTEVPGLHLLGYPKAPIVIYKEAIYTQKWNSPESFAHQLPIHFLFLKPQKYN